MTNYEKILKNMPLCCRITMRSTEKLIAKQVFKDIDTIITTSTYGVHKNGRRILFDVELKKLKKKYKVVLNAGSDGK